MSIRTFINLVERSFQSPLQDPQFRRWFDGSKVVDENGHPLVCYHGTTKRGFSEFYAGAHFGDIEAANTRVNNVLGDPHASRLSGNHGHVYPAYLCIRNPIRIEDDRGLTDGYDLANAALKVGAIDEAEHRDIRARPNSVVARRELFNLLSAKGHDGFVYKNIVEGNADSWIVFRPTQIKSVFNKGSWNPESPNISEDVSREVTMSPEFKAWFGDSKIVNDDGSPRVMYHGTTGDIKAFDPNRIGSTDHGFFGTGFSFSADVETANGYAQFDTEIGSNVMPVYLSVQNPYVWPEGKQAHLTAEDSRAFTEHLKSQGYDGIIYNMRAFYPEDTPIPMQEVVVFSPNQIKSIYNRGTWNQENDNLSEDTTGAFEAWFSGSKIVDQDGNPLRCFHGTRGDFDTFKHGQSAANGYLNTDDNGLGFFFTPDHGRVSDSGPWSGAAGYAGTRQKNGEPTAPTGANIMPVYLAISNPYEFNYLAFVDAVQSAGGGKELRDRLEALGYDGVIRRGPKGEINTVIAFRPDQIKSTLNKGSWSPESEKITEDTLPGIMDNPKFRAWFGQSKIVDSQGQPLIVHHGGKKGIRVFGDNFAETLRWAKQTGFKLSDLEIKSYSNPVHFFTDCRGIADGYADQYEYDEQHRYEVFLKIEHPLDLRPTSVGPEQAAKNVAIITGELPNFEGMNPSRMNHHISHLVRMFHADMAQNCRAHGFDGIIMPDTCVRDRSLHTSFVVFSPNQIKSVESVNFSADNDDIHEEITEDVTIWNEKYVVWSDGSYRIAVDDPEDATYVSLWTDDNKKVGFLSTRRTPDAVGRHYLGAEKIEIDPKHRGKKLGLRMVEVLLRHMRAKWKGISSYLPDQVNQTQVPAIWNRLGGYAHPEDSAHMVIDRK